MLMIERPDLAVDLADSREKSFLLAEQENSFESRHLAAKCVQIKEHTNETINYPKNIVNALQGIQYIKMKLKQDSSERKVNSKHIFL